MSSGPSEPGEGGGVQPPQILEVMLSLFLSRVKGGAGKAHYIATPPRAPPDF